MHTVWCTLYDVHSAMYTVRCTLCVVQCALYTVLLPPTLTLFHAIRRRCWRCWVRRNWRQYISMLRRRGAQRTGFTRSTVLSTLLFLRFVVLEVNMNSSWYRIMQLYFNAQKGIKFKILDSPRCVNLSGFRCILAYPRGTIVTVNLHFDKLLTTTPPLSLILFCKTVWQVQFSHSGKRQREEERPTECCREGTAVFQRAWNRGWETCWQESADWGEIRQCMQEFAAQFKSFYSF